MEEMARQEVVVNLGTWMILDKREHKEVLMVIDWEKAH